MTTSRRKPRCAGFSPQGTAPSPGRSGAGFAKPRAVLAAATAALAGLAWLAPPVAQPVSYHAFADRRACFALPNCVDVVSNLGFVFAAIAGLCFLSGAAGRRAFLDAREARPYRAFFLAVALIGFASAAYHWAPDTPRLAWDRAAMALALMAWLAALLAERVGVQAGLALLPPLAAGGLGAVLYWAWSETQGRGDLRPWLLIQLLPIVLVPLLYWLYPPRYSHGHDMLTVIALYLVALLLDLGDGAVFALTGGTVGGHALKHVVAALAAWWVVRHLRRRRPP